MSVQATEADMNMADAVVDSLQREYGQEVWITGGHRAGIALRELIAQATATAREEGLNRAKELAALREEALSPLGEEAASWRYGNFVAHKCQLPNADDCPGCAASKRRAAASEAVDKNLIARAAVEKARGS